MTRVEYQTQLVSAIWEMPDSIDAIAQLLRDARADDRQILIAGNGGSSATADHFACDLARNAGEPLRAISLCANAANLTATANDDGYERVFARQVYATGRTNDVLFVISASGNSPSIIEAMKEAVLRQMFRVALVGFDGGHAMKLATHTVHIESSEYGIVEDAHLSVCHILTELLK